MTVIASNDSDLQQLLDENTVVLKMPPWHEASGLPFYHVTAASFQNHYGFPPKAFPAHLAFVGMVFAP